MIKPVLKVFQTLSPTLKKQIDDFRLNVPDIHGRIRTKEEEKERLERYCSDYDIKSWILVFAGDELIGTTVIFGRIINQRATRISLGGIGKVRVRIDWRRKGISTLMMNEAMEQLKKMQFDVVFLSTDLNSFLADFYQQYGFVPLHKSYTYIGNSGKSYVENNGMLAAVTSKEIFQKITTDKAPFNIGQGNW